MSCFDVQILNPNINTIEIETCIGDQPSSIDIVTYDNISTVEINHCIALLPSEINELITVKDILAGSGISVSDSSGIYTISLLDPTISATGILDLLETVQDIIGQSGLIAGNYIAINYDDNTGFTTVSTTGLQPSGNYSVVGHTHTSSNITDFNSSVSGLLPVKNISAGSGIGVSSTSGNFTVSVTGTFGLTSEEVDDRISNLLVAGNYVNLNYNDLGNSLTISVTGVQPSGNYSLVGHSHNSSDITNFDSAVSGLLPSVSGSGYIISSFANNVYILSASGLQPSGNYSEVGHSHVIADVSGLQNALDSKQPSGVYASGIHSHVSNDITDFNTSVSGLLPIVTGVGYLVSNFNNNTYTITATGLQPSGDYSVVGHNHTSSDITDFNTSVSGLIPPSNFTSLTGISGIIVTNSGTNYFVSLSDPSIQLGDITDLPTNARTFLLTSSSDNLRSLINDETGSGILVFNDSPALSGIPTVPTAPSGTNTSQIASTAFVRAEITNLIDSAPSALDTLNELAAALGDDPNFATTVTNTLASKANLSGAVFTGSVTIPSGTGNFNSLTVNGINISVSGHTHLSSDITDFNTSVSGLLPVKNIIAGSGIGISSTSGDYTVSVTGNFGLTSEEVDDRVSNLLVAGNYVNLNYNDLANSLTVSVTGLQPSGNYSVAGHTHEISDVNGLQIALDGKQPSGIYASGIHSHGNISNSGTIGSISGLLVTTGSSGILTTSSGINSSYITNFNSSVSGLLPSVSGSGYVATSFNNNVYTISVTGVQPSGNYSEVGHSHVTNDITNFASGVSGIIDNALNTSLIAGTGINLIFDDNLDTLTISVTGLQPSGNYSIVGHSHVTNDISNFNTSVSGLIPVKDIVAGTGIGVSSTSGIYTINSSNTIAADTLEPDGFVNRTDSTISFNDASRQFSIAPKAPATSYAIYNNGVKVVKSSTETTTLPDTTALYFIHFDKSTNNLSYKTTGFNFDTDIPVAQIYYNADDNKAVYFGEERHGIRMDTSTHRYLHNVFGTQYVNGLSISNYSTSGDGSADSDATVAIGDGLIYDEDIDVNITNSASPSDPFEQILYPIAQIPVYYKVGSNGAWTDTTANNFPVKVGTTAQYNLNSAGVWSAANSNAPSNNRYLASWICATSQEHAPIIAIMGQRLDSSLEQATSNNSWGDLNLNGLPIVELRPLYRLIYDTKSSFTNGAKAFLVDVLDIRSHIDTVTGLTQNDHGNLYGLADDDHYQYVHIDNARTIDAIHTFTNGISFGDSTTQITAWSGVNNAANNRILTSDGTINGIIAESALTFDPDNQTLSGGPILKLSHEQTVDNISTGESSWLILSNYSREIPSSAGRIQFEKSRGTQSSPLPLENGDTLGVVRFSAPNNSGVLSNSARILVQSQGTASGVNTFVPTVMTLNTSSGPNNLDNSLILYSDGQLYSNGYLQIVQTNNRLDPSPNSGKNYGLGVYIATSGLSGSVDPNTPHTIYGIASNVSPRSPNSNHTMYYCGNVAGVYSELPSGVTNSGAIYGSIAGAWRNSRGANVGGGWYDDNGTLSQLFGSVINYGHSLGQSGIYGPAPTGLTSYTENAYGLYIAPHKGYGTIDTAYDLLIADTNYNTGTINNHYGIYQDGNRQNHFEGSLKIDNGLSSPTPIFALGSVSGNVSINYDINKQIQTLTLSGTNTNFIEGTGWDIANKSVDVLLEITVSSTTSVIWTLIDDQYNPFPSFVPGKYLVLLRSMGTTIQGHYLGNKTN